MRKLISLILFFIPYSLFAQNTYTDSLQKLLSANKKQDTIRVKLLLRYGNAVWNSNHEEGEAAAQQAIELSEELGWKKGSFNAILSKSHMKNLIRQFAEATQLGLRALKIAEEINDTLLIGEAHENLASIYHYMNNDQLAEYYSKKTLEYSIPAADTESIRRAYINLAELKAGENKWDSAIYYTDELMKIAMLRNDQSTMMTAYFLRAEKETVRGNYSKAKEYYQQIYHYKKEHNDHGGIAFFGSQLGWAYSLLGKKDSAYYFGQLAINEAEKYGLRKELNDGYLNLYRIAAQFNDYKEALSYYLINDSLNAKDYDQEVIQQVELAKTKFEQDKLDAITQAEMRRQKTIRNSSLAGLAGLLLFSFIVVKQRNNIKKEKRRSDELLLNILPSETAEELKQNGSAKAKSYDEVTVMFTDFKNFTSVAEKLSAEELVKEINYCYSEFDKIISKYNIEKIKTIGDSYMCAGGLPVPNKTNAEDILKAAMEIRDFMATYTSTSSFANSGKTFGIRIGVHTGPVIAGIVGIKKFAYDIWGDTVNIASRMESSGEAGKVNISGATYELVKDKFNFTYRGKIPAKNKGEIDMYFAERLM